LKDNKKFVFLFWPFLKEEFRKGINLIPTGKYIQ